MKIFNSDQLKKWDAATISEQEITTSDLVRRAAYACFVWMQKYDFIQKHIRIFCGKGNNGADGLALASLLIQHNANVSVYILESGKTGTETFQQILQELHLLTKEIHFIQQGFSLPVFDKDDLVIDALFGTGLHKPLVGIPLQLVELLNNTSCQIISLDIPSGLFTDKSSKGNLSIAATHTLSFQQYKIACLFAENSSTTGRVHLLDIQLSNHFEETEFATYEMAEEPIVKALIKPRDKFSNKGNFGHAALVVGSYGMMGSAVLAARSCMRTGAGKLTCYIPAVGYDIMQTTVPEAMCKTGGQNHLQVLEPLASYSAIGIGPGIGTEKEIARLLRTVFKDNHTGLLLDADALNCLAADQQLLSSIPAGTVITPHPKEFDRLFGDTGNDFERLDLAIQKAAELHIYVVLKGHYTAIITPMGKVYFNNTGNAGMAKAGMGDVLTGIITGLMAQQYALPEAVILGVWLHGLAGDIAAEKRSQQAMQATDLIDCLPDAWRLLVA